MERKVSMNAKVSVIVPVFNVEKYIGRCLDSVTAQTLTDLEIILVDDGSFDNSGEILDKYAESDTRIQVIHKQNSGVSAARNDGLKISTGDYIYIMDSDDYLETDALSRMYENAIETNADVIISDHYTFTNEDFQTPNYFFPKEFVTDNRAIIMQIQNMVLHPGYSPYQTTENMGLGIGAPWTKLLKRELIDSNQLRFDLYVKGIFDDGLFSLYVFEYAKKISYIRACTYHYRILQSSLMRGYDPNRIEVNNKVFRKIKQFYQVYQKDSVFLEAYYARIVLYINYLFVSYLSNEKYVGTVKQNFSEFKQIMKAEPYLSALKNADTKRLRKKERRVVVLARLHLYLAIWLYFWYKK